MFLLEDSGLQTYQPSSFQPLSWSIPGGNVSAGSAHPSGASRPPSPSIPPPPPPPAVPVSNITVAPFPVMSPPYVPTSIPVTNSPYSLGLQPRMPMLRNNSGARRPLSAHQSGRVGPGSGHGHPSTMQDPGFTPINPHAGPAMLPPQASSSSSSSPSSRQQYVHSQMRHGDGGVDESAARSRHTHRLDRVPRSQQRKSGHRH